jgi:hypothetical protein
MTQVVATTIARRIGSHGYLIHLEIEAVVAESSGSNICF